MARLTLNRKLWLTLVTVWVGVLVLTALGAWQTHRLLIHDRQEQLKITIDEAQTLVTHYHHLAETGALTDTAARQQAAQAVALLRSGTDGYVSINTTHGVMVMHPTKPELNGRDMSGFRTSTGLALFETFGRLGREQPDGAYLDYTWPKPGSSAPVAKMGYVRAFQPWDWCLVTGAYLDDLNAAFLGVLLRWLGLSLVLSLAISAIVVLIVRSIRRSMGGDLELAIAVAHRIAGGDLTGAVPVTGDNPESLLAVLAEMQGSLVTTVQQVRQGTEAIHTGAREIAAGNQDLSQRTEEQASALAETAASMEELSATVTNNAANAGEAVRLAQDALKATTDGDGAVGHLRERMDQIAGSSRKIGDILAVIDGIAFQTNILALNAAVEAARAGEQGRGFAVVAGEVRTLAQRSGAAAKEIKALIQDSEASVKAGVSAMDEARTSMVAISTSIRKVTTMVEGIATASDEQRQGIGQVATAVGQMDTVTQQNAALVEEAAAASSSLEDQAHRLTESVAFLKV